MIHKCFFLLIYFLFLSPICKGQTSIDTRNYQPGGTMVTMNLLNLIRISEMSHTEFETLTQKYDYKFSQDGCYIWQGGGIGELFSMCKNPGTSSYIWTSNNDMVNKLKDELEPHLKGYSDGRTVYRLAYQMQKYEVFWKDNGPGGVVVLFKRGSK